MGVKALISDVCLGGRRSVGRRILRGTVYILHRLTEIAGPDIDGRSCTMYVCIKLYCLVTEAHACGRLIAVGRYL